MDPTLVQPALLSCEGSRPDCLAIILSQVNVVCQLQTTLITKLASLPDPIHNVVLLMFDDKEGRHVANGWACLLYESFRVSGWMPRYDPVLLPKAQCPGNPACHHCKWIFQVCRGGDGFPAWLKPALYMIFGRLFFRLSGISVSTQTDMEPCIQPRWADQQSEEDAQDEEDEDDGRQRQGGR